MNWLGMKRQNPDLDKFQLQLGVFFFFLVIHHDWPTLLDAQPLD